MRFEVLPAIDVAAGRLARYTPSGPEPVAAFDGDPLAAARSFVEAGAQWLHVVDMDLAFTGEAANLGVIRAIADLGARVQASGGVANVDEIRALLDAGAQRVVLGSAALVDRGGVEAAIALFGDRLAIGIEVSHGRVGSRGRGDETDLDLGETLAWLAEIGATRFVVTAVDRVGGLEGADASTTVLVAKRTGRPVLASGGIATLDDLRRLAATEQIEGAIVGRAALEGGLDLGQVLRLEA